MRHHCNLRDLAHGEMNKRMNKRASRTSLLVVSLCRCRTDLRAIPAAHGIACLNAKSRHCRSRYLCEHALVKHSSIWPVSRPISSTRSRRRVSPAHATRKIGRHRKMWAVAWKEGKREGGTERWH